MPHTRWVGEQACNHTCTCIACLYRPQKVMVPVCWGAAVVSGQAWHAGRSVCCYQGYSLWGQLQWVHAAQSKFGQPQQHMAAGITHAEAAPNTHAAPRYRQLGRHGLVDSLVGMASCMVYAQTTLALLSAARSWCACLSAQPSVPPCTVCAGDRFTGARARTAGRLLAQQRQRGHRGVGVDTRHHQSVRPGNVDTCNQGIGELWGREGRGKGYLDAGRCDKGSIEAMVWRILGLLSTLGCVNSGPEREVVVQQYWDMH